MLENATRLCEASYGNMLLWEGDAYRMAAVHGVCRRLLGKNGGLEICFVPARTFPSLASPKRANLSTWLTSESIQPTLAATHCRLWRLMRQAPGR